VSAYCLRTAGIKLVALAVALVGIIGYELRSYSVGGASSEARQIPAFVQKRDDSVVVHDETGYLSAVLARPLFQSDRRPFLNSAKVEPSVGRLTAIMITENDKRLIFSGAPGGKPVVVTEGDHIGSDIVQSISTERASLAGPDGVKFIQPSFDEPEDPSVPKPQAATVKPTTVTEPQSRMSKRH
jgi:hypothetical protein